MGAEDLSYVKSIATFALTFFGYIVLVLASVKSLRLRHYESQCHSHSAGMFDYFITIPFLVL